MKKQTIVFEDEIESTVEEYRARIRPIPTFQDAVIELVKKGAKQK